MANTVSHDQNFKNLILDYPGDIDHTLAAIRQCAASPGRPDT